MNYSLYRMKKGTNAWVLTTSGKLDYIMECLNLNLLDKSLSHFEWKLGVN